jgi:hypothetical protein
MHFMESNFATIYNLTKPYIGKIFGNGGAEEMLGMNPTTLHSKLKKLGIDKRQF